MAEKMAVSRKESLKQSLQKIKDYEEKTSRIEHALANKSASESKLFLTSESRVHKKREYLNTEYEHTVKKLKEKGIFDLPEKNKLN
jgi:predicted transcriptional regulator YheO